MNEKLTIIQTREQKIDLIYELRGETSSIVADVSGVIVLLERGPGASELAFAKTKLQEARHWMREALDVLGDTPVAVSQKEA